MRRKDRLDEIERSGQESKSTGPRGAIARSRIFTRAHSRSRHGGVPVGSILAVAVSILLVASLVAAPVVGQTGSFDGSVSLSGTAATSSTSWSYEIADLDSVSDLSVELEGDRVTESRSESSWLAAGESYTITPAGNAPPENATVEIEGVREETPRSVSVSDGGSIDVGGNVDPVNESIEIAGAGSLEDKSASGTSTGSESLSVGGNAAPSDATVMIDGEETQSEESSSNYIDNGANQDWEFEATWTGDDIPDYIHKIEWAIETDYSSGNSHSDAGTLTMEVDGNQVLQTDAGGCDEYETCWFDADMNEDTSGANEVYIHVSGLFYNDGSTRTTVADEHLTTRTGNVSISSSSDSATISGMGTGTDSRSLAISSGSETIDISAQGSIAGYTIDWTEDHRAYDPTVSVGSATVSHTGPLGSGSTVSEPVNFSTGSRAISISSTGAIGGATVNFSEVSQSEDVAVDVDGSTVYEPGLLDDGETVSSSIDLSETSSSTIDRTGGNGDAIVRTSWSEVAETQNPSVTVNGETASYSGTLAEGSTTELDVSDNWIVEGENTVDVDLDGSNGGPEPQVGVSYSHTASTVAVNETVNSSTWSEDVEVARTFASAQSNVTLRIGMPDNVVGIGSIEERRDGGSWSSVSSDRYQLDGTDLSVDMGDVAANESVEVRAVGDKTRVSSGSIEVLEPTLEGATLSTRMRVTSVGEDPLGIEVSETSAGDRIHTIESAAWETSEYHVSKADGTETLYLPSSVDGGEATIETAPISVSPESGDARTEIVNRSELRFTIGPGSSSGDELEVAYLDTESGQYYELFSVTEDRSIDVDQAESPAYFSTDDREGTYLIRLTDPPGSGVVVGGPSGGGGGLPPALLLLAGILGVGGVGIVSNRLGMGRRITIPVAAFATIAIAELATPSSLIGTLSNDLLRSSSTTLVASVVTAGALAGTWVISRRFGWSAPTWVYGAIGVGGAAWIASSSLGDAGSSVVGILVGGGILVALWGASRRWSIPRWLLGVIGAGASLFMLDSIAPAILDELVAAIADGAGQVAPLVVLGLLVAFVVWLRRRGGGGDAVTLEVIEGENGS